MNEIITEAQDIDVGRTWVQAPDWGVVSLQGEDAEKFLQGQGTADLGRLQAGHSLPYATLSLKGRVMELMHLLPYEAGILLLMPRACIASYLQRMRPYIAFSRAQLQDVSASWQVGLSLHEHDAGKPLHQLESHGPARATWLDGRHRLWAVPRELSVSSPSLPAERFVGAFIEMGRAIISPPLQDRYLPQVLHLQVLEGLSFEKGCYTGQEVVARAWFRGQIKQSLCRLQGIAEGESSVGASIFLAEGSQLQPVGEILQTLVDGKSIDLLAVLRHDARQGRLLLQSSTHELRQIDLPYAITQFDHQHTR